MLESSCSVSMWTGNRVTAGQQPATVPLHSGGLLGLHRAQLQALGMGGEGLAAGSCASKPALWTPLCHEPSLAYAALDAAMSLPQAPAARVALGQKPRLAQGLGGCGRPEWVSFLDRCGRPKWVSFLGRCGRP